MKILITGGLGFIFSHVSEILCADDHEIIVVDAHLDGSCPSLVSKFEEKGIKCIKCRCQDIDDCDLDYDLIIHAAAESNVDKSIGSVAPFVQSNILGTINMLEIAKQQKDLKAFIYISTDEVNSPSKEYQDGSIIDPQNPYSASKASGGHFVWAYANTYGIPVEEVRMCNVIGERQANTKLIPKAIETMNAGKLCEVYGDGLATREYIDVKDVAKCFKELIDVKWGLNSVRTDLQMRIVNEKLHLITWNQELSILEALAKISHQLEKPFQIRRSERLGHDQHYRMIPTSLPRVCLQNPIKFKETVKNVNQFLKRNV